MQKQNHDRSSSSLWLWRALALRCPGGSSLKPLLGHGGAPHPPCHAHTTAPTKNWALPSAWGCWGHPAPRSSAALRGAGSPSAEAGAAPRGDSTRNRAAPCLKGSPSDAAPRCQTLSTTAGGHRIPRSQNASVLWEFRALVSPQPSRREVKHGTSQVLEAEGRAHWGQVPRKEPDALWRRCASLGTLPSHRPPGADAWLREDGRCVLGSSPPAPLGCSNQEDQGPYRRAGGNV